MNYLEKIRRIPCLICRSEAEPHHLKAIGMGRDRKKDLIEHLTAIPLCRKHHTEIHTLGQKTFEEKHKINLWKQNFFILMKHWGKQ